MRYLTILLCLLLVSCSGKTEAPTTMPAPAPKLGLETHSMDDRLLTKKMTKKPKKIEVVPEDDVVSQLYNASMVFTMPDKANVNDNVRAHLIIDPSKTVEELVKDAGKNIQANGEIKVSRIILARLIAPDFTVTPITPEEQALAKSEPTIWLWNLDPKEAGVFTADLVITAVVKVDDKSTVHNIKTFSKELTIEVKPQQIIKSWLEKYWQWLTTSFILPIGIWLYKRRKSSEEVT